MSLSHVIAMRTRLIMKKQLQIIFSILFLAFSLTGCKSNVSSSSMSSKQPNQDISIHIMGNPDILDPRKVEKLSDITIVRMFMDGLTRIDKNGNNALAVAKKIDISPDKKIYTFTLRDSKWSNGLSLTSFDFAHAWKKSLSPNFHAPNAPMLYVIKNAKEAKMGHLPLSLVGIETPDEKTLVVTLDHSVPYFIELLNHPIFFPVNKDTDHLNPEWSGIGSTYVGNGPFVIDDWQRDNILLAKKNSEYWDQQVVKLTNIKMVMTNKSQESTLLDTEQVSWSDSPFSVIPLDTIDSLKRENKLHTTPLLGTQWIRVNVEKYPFQNKNFRKALGYAIDRQQIVNTIEPISQIPATGIVPLEMQLQKNPLFTDHSISLAETLFHQSLHELDTTIHKLPTISLLYPLSAITHLIAQKLQNQWLQAFGIKIELEGVDNESFFDRISKNDYTLSLGNWFADFNDPINFLEIFNNKAIDTNHTNWENTRYTELLETSYNCHSKQERDALLAQSEELLISEMPVIPILHFNTMYFKDNKLKDVVLTKMGGVDFKWAYID